MKFLTMLILVFLWLPLVGNAGVDLLPEKTTSETAQPGMTVGTPDSSAATQEADIPWGFIVLMLMLSSFFFLFLEIAIIPGFGITGIIGILLLLGGLIIAYLKLSTAMAILATVSGIAGVILLMLWFFFIFPHTRLGKQFVLQGDSGAEEGYLAVEDNQRYLGKEGVTATMLRPSGIARIDGERLDVITDGQFVEKGVAVKVVKTGAGRIIVSPVERQD